MRSPIPAALAACLFWSLACSGGSDEVRPPPPPPPDGVVEAPPTPDAPPEAPPEAPPPVDPKLLPPPWGDLGLGYGTTTVLRVEPGAAVLVTTSAAAPEAVALFEAWQAKLGEGGFVAAAAATTGDDVTQLWTRGERRIAIAHGLVDTTAWVYAEDLQLNPAGAIAGGTMDEAVKRLLPGGAAAPTPRPAVTHSDLPGKNHPFQPPTDRGAGFSPARDGKSGGGKKPGGKGKGRKGD
jgi:hypothetical protein